MRRRGLRKETADLDKKIWDWSLTEPSASATKIRKFAKTLFCEAGYENFKASECWYRRWRNRWRNHSDKKDEASNDPTELKHDSTENKLPKRNSARMKRRNSEDTKDCIDNTGIPSKRPNPGEGSSDKTDNLQISSCSENDKLFSNDDDQNNRSTIEIEKQVGIPSDKLYLNRSVDQENDVVFPLIEFRNISTKSGTQDTAVEFNSQYCSQLGISDNTPLLMDSEHIASSSSIRKDRFCLETLMPEINICSLDGISDVNPLKTHEEDSRSSLQELQNKIVDTTTLMEEIDSRLGQISDECCFKNQTNVPFSLINESNISIRDCETIEGVNRNNEAYLEENGMSASNSKAENSFNHAVNNLNDKIDPFSCGSAKPLTVSSDITSQVTNCESFCINGNVKNTIQFENFLDISNESIFPNFSEANFEDKTYGTDQSNKTPNEIVNRSTENFVDIYSDSEFPSFPLSDIGEDNTTDKSNKLFSELKSVGLDLCGKDQHSLELMKVINDHLNENAENSVSSDNLDACLMSAEFQIPGLSLGSEEIFEFYRNSLFMESNYMFCESCDDFHMNEIEACEDVSNYEEVLSLKGPDSESQTKSSEQESVSKNEEESNKETDLCSTDGDGSDKQAKQGESSNGQKERKKHERYLPKFKSKVAAYAKSHSIRAAALKFNLYYGSVADWTHEKMRKDKEQDFKPYKESESIKVEEQFLNWLKSMRESKKPVNKPLIREKLQDLIKPVVSLEKITEKWLKHYLERLKNEDVAVESNQMVNDKKTSKKYVYHSLSFKREVALYAEMFSQKAASRDFGIARRRVGEWMKSAKTNSQEQHGSEELGKRDCSKYVADATIDRDILDWYKSQSVPPTSKQVREMGLKLYADGGYDVSCSSGWWRRWSKRHQVRREAMSSLDNHILEFVLSQLDRNVKVSHADLIEYVSKINRKSSSKVSSGWVIRFCKRYPTLLQRTPQFNTNLPPAMELKVLSFRKRIQKLIGDFKLTGSEIGTIDEIPLRFTDTGTSLKQQLIRNSGFDNCQASLVVSCLANGRLLPSIVIVKGSKPEDLIMSNKEVMVFVRENSCLDSDIFMHWIKHIWSMFQTQETSILVSNNFHPYKDAKAREELSAVSCKHEFFPPGCLSKLQPIRIALSTAFQDGLYNFWKKKMKKTSWDDELSINLPSHRVIFGWTTKIHKKIAATFQEEIASSFKKTLLAECEEKSVHDNTIESIIQQTHNQTESSNKTVID